MKVMVKNVVIFTTFFLLSQGNVFSQRIYNVIKGQSLVSHPILLIRSGNISDLEIINLNFPDTVAVGEVVTITADLQNTGSDLFDGDININFGFELENDLNNPEADQNEQLTNVVLNLGESLSFTKDVIIDPQKINPNSTNVIIVWPTFRVGLNESANNDNPNFSLCSFFITGLDVDSQGTNKTSNMHKPNLRSSSIFLQENAQFDTYFDLIQYISKNNIKIEQGSIYTTDGKLMHSFNDIRFPLNQLNNLKKNKNTFFIVSMRVKNPVKQQHVYVKTNTMYW